MTRCRMDYKAVCITIFCACMFEEISFYNQSDNTKGEEGKVKTMVIRKVETPNYDSARLTRLMKFIILCPRMTSFITTVLMHEFQDYTTKKLYRNTDPIVSFLVV